MIKSILSILFLSVFLFCCMAVKKKPNQQFTMKMEKESVGNLLAFYAKPMMVTGEEIVGKVNVSAIDRKGMCTKLPMASDGIVRLSKIEVFPEYLDVYKTYAIEVGEISLRTEPGVLTMYAVQEKANPCMITILETYADQAAYTSHIQSKHFLKYKRETLHMIKSLMLLDQTPLSFTNKINNFIQ